MGRGSAVLAPDQPAQKAKLNPGQSGSRSLGTEHARSLEHLELRTASCWNILEYPAVTFAFGNLGSRVRLNQSRIRQFHFPR